MSSVNSRYDGIVVGSGPNGLAAAIRLAQRKLSVLVVEAAPNPGGGLRSEELTLPGFTHDVCSAVHPMALASPFLRTLPLEEFGLKWIHPEIPLANTLGPGGAVALRRSVAETAEGLGADGAAYQRLFGPLVKRWEHLAYEFLQPLPHWPKHPIELAAFGMQAMRSANGLVKSWFKTDAARALVGGLAGHSFLDLKEMPSASFGLVLGMMGHAVGWPVAQGGTRQFGAALIGLLRSLGGEVQTGFQVNSLAQLPASRVVLLDVGPRQFVRMAGDQMPAGYRRRLERFQYGPGIFKIDYAMSGPPPWTSDICSRAGTLHIGASYEEIALAEQTAAKGEIPERPFLLLTQPTRIDPSRAPAGRHIVWCYCHVPNGSTVDMTSRIEAQLERFAPGFRDLVLARRTTNAVQQEQKNANMVGGDVNGGRANIRQLLARPVLSAQPYRTPLQGVYLCSASTPPGGGVHGMCGFHAAELALREHFK